MENAQKIVQKIICLGVAQAMYKSKKILID